MAEQKSRSKRADAGEGLGGFQRLALFAILGVLVLSVVARAFVGGGGPEGSDAGAAGGPPGAAGLVASGPSAGQGEAGQAAAEPGSLEALLPFFTESSFFALIGFALGYATRKAVKLMLIVVAVFFAGLQGLVYAGVAEVDWGQAVELLNGLILNVKQDQTWTEILKAKVPAAGGLLGGYLLGFRRG